MTSAPGTLCSVPAHPMPCIDPQLSMALVDEWRDRFGIVRLDYRKARIQDVAAELNALPPMPKMVGLDGAVPGIRTRPNRSTVGCGHGMAEHLAR